MPESNCTSVNLKSILILFNHLFIHYQTYFSQIKRMKCFKVTIAQNIRIHQLFLSNWCLCFVPHPNDAISQKMMSLKNWLLLLKVYSITKDWLKATKAHSFKISFSEWELAESGDMNDSDRWCNSCNSQQHF